MILNLINFSFFIFNQTENNFESFNESKLKIVNIYFYFLHIYAYILKYIHTYKYIYSVFYICSYICTFSTCSCHARNAAWNWIWTSSPWGATRGFALILKGAFSLHSHTHTHTHSLTATYTYSYALSHDRVQRSAELEIALIHRKLQESCINWHETPRGRNPM